MAEDLLGEREVTVTRFAPGSYTNGRWVKGTGATSTILMSVQPLNGEELSFLPEGNRSDKIQKGYTRSFVQTANQNEGIDSDIITVDGEDYEVTQVQRYSAKQPHYKCKLVRKWPS